MNETDQCAICHKKRRKSSYHIGASLSDSTFQIAKTKNSELNLESNICENCINDIRAEHFEDLIKEEYGELNQIEDEVVESIRQQDLITENLNQEFEGARTFSDRVSDGIATFVGSWVFILVFAFFLLGWMIVNSIILINQPPDPYPYILLNLILSSVAAFQAPIIMMSQNRQAEKDRLRSDNDYQVNLKAELQIRHLTRKIDQLMNHQWRRLMEIQKIQMDMLRTKKE